jgi:hypothetical protein
MEVLKAMEDRCSTCIGKDGILGLQICKIGIIFLQLRLAGPEFEGLSVMHLLLHVG